MSTGRHEPIYGASSRSSTGLTDLGAHDVTLSLKIPLELRVRLKIAAASRGLTMTDMLIQMLERVDKVPLPEEQALKPAGSVISR